MNIQHFSRTDMSDPIEVWHILVVNIGPLKFAARWGLASDWPSPRWGFRHILPYNFSLGRMDAQWK